MNKHQLMDKSTYKLYKIVALVFLFSMGNNTMAQNTLPYALKKGTEIYAGIGPNYWWSNANPGLSLSASMAGGFNKNIYHWLQAGFNLELGRLHGKRVIGTYEEFSSTTMYARAGVLAFIDINNLARIAVNTKIHAKVFSGASIGFGSINIQKPENSTRETIYDLNRDVTSYTGLLIPGGAMLEYEVNDKISVFGSITGVLELTDELDGIRYNAVYPNNNPEEIAGNYKYYDQQKHTWVGSVEYPTDEILDLNWHDNFVVAQIGIKYHFSKLRSPAYKNTKGGSKDNYGKYKRMPQRYKDYRGHDGLNKKDRPMY